MKKGKELKKRTAALLIASMIAANLTTPVLAEPGAPSDTGEITSQETKWGETNVTMFCANGNSATIALENGETKMYLNDFPEESVVLKPKKEDGVVAVYAGRWDSAAVTEPVTLTMESGTVDFLIGGSAGIENEQASGFKLSDSTINLKGGTVQDVMANRPSQNPSGFEQCQNNLVDTCTINILGGTVKGQVGGTFSYSQVNNLNVNMTGGTIGQRLVLGGTNGYVKDASLTISGGKTPNVSVGLRALVENMDISITGGNAGEIYAGSYYPDEETSLGAKPGSEKPWNGWSIGGVDYGVAKNIHVTVSGKAKYNGIYGGFQHGIQKASSSEIEVFEDTYASKIPKAISDAYSFSEPTKTVINYSVNPQSGKNYKYTKDLLKEKTENVTVNNYTDSKLTISETSSKLKLGELKELTAEYKTADGATPSEASPGEADYVWTSTDENVVSVTPSGEDDNTAELTALKPGTATVKVTYRGILEASCNVTVSSPDLSVSLKSKMDYADENTWLIAKVNNIADDLKEEVAYEVSADRPGLTFEKEQDGEPGRLQVFPEYGLSGTYNITVTARIDESEFKKTKTLTVNQPKFAVMVTDGSKSLDVKNSETALLEVVSDYDDYDSYEWFLEGNAVEMASMSELSAVEVTAVKEGTAVISVKAKRDSFHEKGPEGGQNVPEVTAEASITIKVADTRKFQADKSFVELDINPEAEKRSETVVITNDYGDDVTVDVVDDTQPVTAELKDGTLTISTTAEETGSATVIISRENGETIEIPVIIKTTAIVAEVKNGIKVEVKDGAVSVPEVKTEGLNEEQKAQAEAKTAEQAGQVKKAITDVFTQVSSDDALAEYLAARTEGTSEVAMEYTTDNGLKVENGDIVKVYPKQELRNVELDTAVNVNAETGEVTVSTVIKRMTFDIKLMLDKMDENDRTVAGGTLNIPRTNRTPISFPVPLPNEGLAENVNYVKVTHAGDVDYFPIQKNGEIRYTVITTYHFSPFELEFVEEIPVVHHSSRSGKGSSYTSGKWVQNLTGWWYKNPDGSWPANCWKQLLWNNQMEWYHFNTEGYMTAGWYTDTDGNRYFLHNVSDGNQGHMYTGWHQIEGKWYYFKENEGGPKGSLLVNGTTPDGHQTDLDGVCSTYQPQ